MPAVRVPLDARVVDIFTGQDRDSGTGTLAPPELDLSTAPVRTLETGAYLFEEGDRKSHAYRVESGALSLFTLDAEGSPELLDIIHPGDFVGLGFLDRHTCHARAERPTVVSCLSDHLVAAIAATNSAFTARIDAAQRAEMEIVRSRATRASRRQPLIRVAAFLLVTSQNNASEGRDPSIISDELACGTVAGYLDLELEQLGDALRRLADLGIVAVAPGHALRIIDRPALERLVDNA